MRTKILVLGFVCLFLIACATAPVPRQIVNTFPIEKSFDLVWQAVIESFAELQLPIQNMEKDSGLITTDWIDFKGQKNTDYCDCGGLGINVERSRNGRFNVFVKNISKNSCEIKVNCIYQQTIQPVTAKAWDAISTRKCISTGKLEKDMFELIKSKLDIK